jgi:hypothetical protein
MTAIVIGIILFIFTGVLFFTLALCRSAAKADRAYERARLAERRTWPMSAELLEAHKEINAATDTKTDQVFEHSKVHT